jgi:molecular chaperone Hsp33
MKPLWTKCISTTGTIRGVAIQATALAQEAAKRHGLQGQGAQGVGEALLGGLLLASNCKEGEHINLNIRGTGFYSQALVDAYPEGHCRGFVVCRETPESTQGPWGEGLLSVLRSNQAQEHRQPYIGTVPLATGHLAKDLTFYLFQSEQVPSAVGISVLLDSEGAIESAGGFLVQALPGADEKDIDRIANQVQQISGHAEQFIREGDPLKILTQIFSDLAFVVLEQKELSFACDCSMDRVSRALALVGPDEIRSMIEQDGRAKVHCDFCSREYEIGEDALRAMISG